MLNLYKKGFILLILCLFAGNLYAQDNKRGWQVELKKIALDITSTEVKNAKEYQEFSDARLNGDSQSTIRGNFDGIADYHAQHFLWTNELLMDYGRTQIRPINEERITNENADKILLTTGYTQRLWKVEDILGGFEVGPFVNLGYETEFTKPNGANRKKVLRGTGGIKLFEGKYLKDLFVAIVGERDFTYDPASNKLAWEAGLKVEQPVREGVTAKYSVLFRDYLKSSHEQATDLDYEFGADARLDVQLYKNLYVAPFISYYTAQGKKSGIGRGENIYVGVSFSFSHIFKQAEEVK